MPSDDALTATIGLVILLLLITTINIVVNIRTQMIISKLTLCKITPNTNGNNEFTMLNQSTYAGKFNSQHTHT